MQPKKHNLFQQIMAVLLCFAMVLPTCIPPAHAAEDAPAAAAANTPLATVFAASDFQPKDASGNPDVAAGEATLNAIIDAMQAAGYTDVDGALLAGDYTANDGTDNEALAKDGMDAVYGVLSSQWGLDDDNSVYVQGNHDSKDYLLANSHLDGSGANDQKDYGVFVIHEDDFPFKAGNTYDITGDITEATAASLELYLQAKLRNEYAKPIFIVSHVPLHYSYRTYDKQDNLWAKYIFDVLNNYGQHLNIFFLFGHNHSDTYDNYLGGSAIYLTEGDTILVPTHGDRTAFTENTLNFTYMNTGYVGYEDTTTEVGLSSSIFTIYDDRVVVERYGFTDGSEAHLVNLKDLGVAGTNDADCGLTNYVTSSGYPSPQTVELKDFAVELVLGNLASGVLDKNATAAVSVEGVEGVNYSVEWSTSNPAIATVTADGMSATVSGVGEGEVTLYATVTNPNTGNSVTLTYRFDVQGVTPSAVTTLTFGGTYFRKVDKFEVGSTYLLVDMENNGPINGQHEALAFSANVDTDKEDDSLQDADNYNNRELNATGMEVFQLPVNGKTLALIYSTNENAQWKFVKNGAGHAIKTVKNRTWTYLSVSEGLEINNVNIYNIEDGDHDRLRMTDDASGSSSNYTWYYSEKRGLYNKRTDDGYQYVLYYSQPQKDFSAYRINHNGYHKDGSGAEKSTHSNEEADSRVYLFKQVNVPNQTLTFQVNDVTGYVNKDVAGTAYTGDNLIINGTNTDGVAATSIIPVTVSMLRDSSGNPIDTSTPGTYENLSVVYGVDGNGDPLRVATGYTLEVRASATLIKNDAAREYMDTVYTLVDEMIPGRQYLIVDSNEASIAHAMGTDKISGIANRIYGYNVLIQSLPVDGKTMLYIDSSRYGSPADQTEAELVGRDIVDQGNINAYLASDSLENEKDAYTPSIRLVWTPTKRIFPYAEDNCDVEYFDVVNNTWSFLMSEYANARDWQLKYLQITANAEDNQLTLFNTPDTGNEGIGKPNNKKQDRWWYQWQYNSGSGMHLYRKDVLHSELFYNYQNIVRADNVDGIANMYDREAIEASPANKNFQTEERLTTADRRVYIYQRVTDIDTISARLGGKNGSVLEDKNAATLTGDYILVDTTHADGTVTTEQVAISTSMLSGNGLDLTSAGTYSDLTVTYQGVVVAEDYTLKVIQRVEEDYPEFPDEGAVKVDKTLNTNTYSYLNTGAATIDLSVAGIPAQSGVDLVIILDASNSMGKCLHGKDVGELCNGVVVGGEGSCPIRMSVLENTLETVLTQLQTPVNGYTPDIQVAIATFNGYTPINTDYELNYIEAGEVIHREAAQSADEDNWDGSKILMNFTAVEDIDPAFLNAKKGSTAADMEMPISQGTNYDRGMELAYDLMKAKQDKNAANGVSRQSVVVFMSDGLPYQYNYFQGRAKVFAWDEYLCGMLDEIQAAVAAGNGSATDITVTLGDTTVRMDKMAKESEPCYAITAAELAQYIPTDPAVKAIFDKYYRADGKHWMAEAIKGNPNTKYTVIDPDAMTEDHVTTVNGLGATLYTIGFGIDSNSEDDGDTSSSTLVTGELIQSGSDGQYVLKNIATDLNHFEMATDQEGLTEAFSSIAQNLISAGDAVFTDQMGPMFDLITANKRTWQDKAADGTTITKTLTFDPAPTITVKRYDTYKRSEIGQSLTFTLPTGATTTVYVTEEMVGSRKPLEPTVIETVTFNDDGTAAYSSLKGENVNILEEGVIKAATFYYNTDQENAKTVALTAEKSVTLETESFYWIVGDIPQDELVMNYPIYLTGSMEGYRAAGTYDTNTHAELNYTNYLDHACVQSVPTPKLPWGQATVGYGFYLVDGSGKPIINQTTGETGSFEQAVRLTQPIYQNFNPNETIGAITAETLADAAALAGYTLYDHGASYQVTLESNGKGTYTVTTADGIHTLTTYVVGVEETPIANTGTVSTTDYATVNTVVWFAVTAEPGCVPDVVVVDFGLSVDVDVMANDLMFGNLGTLTHVGKVDSFQSFSEEPQFETTTADGTVGFAAIRDGEVRFSFNTANGMQMKQEETFVYGVRYTGEAAPGYYYATVTVIPATTIYYEDDFLTYEAYQFWRDEDDNVQSMEITNKEGNANYDPTLHSNHQWSVDGTTLSATQAEDRPGEFSLDIIDANNIYGYDDAYVDMARHSLGSAMKFTASYDEETGKTTYGTAKFTFNGTGFDVISITSGQTGTITVEVDGQYYDEATNAYVPVSEAHIVDTYYGYKYVDTDNDGKPEWIVDKHPGEATGTATSNALYQVPVMKVDGLHYGTYTATITISYNDFFNHSQYGEKKYDFFLDAIRIYDPANDGKDNEVIENAYTTDGEGWPEYFELRNLIIKRNDLNLTDGETVYNGIVYIDHTETEKQFDVADYKNFGPNNELYLAPGQAIAFKLNVTDPTMASIQLALKSVGGSAKVKIYDLADKSAANVLPTGTISSATDLYYKITDLNGKNVVIVNTGDTADAIVSITNVKVTYTAQHTDGIQDGFFTSTVEKARASALSVQKLLYGNEGEEDTGSTAGGLINISGASLSFEDEILTNLYFTLSELEPTEMGLLTWSALPENGTVDNAEQIFANAVFDEVANRYMVSTGGIPAKNLGDDIFMRVYAKTAGGTVYSDVVTYSPKQYAMSRLEKSDSEAMKALCVSMLNYGAAAQKYFGYKTDSLMNADLTAEQQALAAAYDSALFKGAVAAEPGKVGSFAATAGFARKAASVSFEGAFAINYYFTPDEALNGNITFYYWTAETYAAVTTLTPENACGSATMVAADGTYWAAVEGIAAKELDDTYYVAAVYTDASGNRYCTGVIAYSLSKYCMNNANGSMGDLAKATAMYGYYAKNYFA